MMPAAAVCCARTRREALQRAETRKALDVTLPVQLRPLRAMWRCAIVRRVVGAALRLLTRRLTQRAIHSGYVCVLLD
jgi:hypothetical protein